MDNLQPKYKVGDSIKVKPGVMDPDIKNSCIGGWRGRIFKILETEGILSIGIKWDSHTLSNIPSKIIKKCERDGYDFAEMFLTEDLIELDEAQDTEADVSNVIKKLSSKHSWDYLGKQGDRITGVLKNISQDDEAGEYRAWENYLRANLSFPFHAKATNYENLLKGKKATVLLINSIDLLMGVIAAIDHAGKNLLYPLCDLEVIDKKSSNFRLVDDYCTWFANR